MGKQLLFSLLVIALFDVKSQTLEWSKLFEKHSSSAAAPIKPTSVYSEDNAVISVIIESDTLQFYKTQADGTLSAYYISGKRCKEFTPLIRTGTGQAIVFREQSFENNFWLLQTDVDLNVIREIILDFPDFNFTPDIRHLIEYESQLFLTLFDGQEHYMLRINEDDTLTVVYSADVSIAFGEETSILDNGNFLFSYTQGNYHRVRCVSPENGNVIWEHASGLQEWQLLDYKVITNDDEVYKIGIERSWIDGEVDDKIRIIKFDGNTGLPVSESVIIPPGDCTIKMNDFIYDRVNNVSYFSYSHCFPEYGISLLEINPQTLEVSNQNTFEIEHDELSIGEDAYIHINPSGKVTLIYKSFKNDSEKGNIYINPLDDTLNSMGNLEINFSEVNSSEAVTHILPYEESKVFITGIIPNPDPFIFWEEVNYYTLMIDTGGVMSTDNIGLNQFMVYPNPAKDKVNILVSGNDIFDLRIFDPLGRLIHEEKDIQGMYQLDVRSYRQGIYFISLSGKQKTLNRRLVIKK